MAAFVRSFILCNALSAEGHVDVAAARIKVASASGTMGKSGTRETRIKEHEGGIQADFSLKSI